METKICSKCHIDKSLTEFSRCYGSRKGLKGVCKTCMKTYQSQYRINNRNKFNGYHHKNYYNNLELYRQKNRENMRKWRAKNPEYSRKMNTQNKIAEYHRKKNDIKFIIPQRLRRRIRETVKNNYKCSSSLSLLGCSVQEFITYFKSKMTVDMTWEAFMRGEIHIDHIRPCDSFDLTKEEEQKICFHYTNMQPLWAADNIRKSNKF